MIDFGRYSEEILLLITFPVVGFLFTLILSQKQLRLLAIITAVMVLPFLLSYFYILPWLNIFIPEILFAAVFALSTYNLSQWGRFIRAVWVTGFLFIPFVPLLMNAFLSGEQSVESRWSSGGYRIEYTKDQGFSGGALMRYELSKYALIPVLAKKLEAVREDADKQTCTVRFTESRITFDRCAGSIKRDE